MCITDNEASCHYNISFSARSTPYRTNETRSSSKPYITGHLCWESIGNGLLHIWRQAIPQSNTGLLSVGPIFYESLLMFIQEKCLWKWCLETYVILFKLQYMKPAQISLKFKGSIIYP